MGAATICVVQLTRLISKRSVRIKRRRILLNDSVIAAFPSMCYQVKTFSVYRSMNENAHLYKEVEIGLQNLANFAIFLKNRLVYMKVKID
jgi:hypothetical protein